MNFHHSRSKTAGHQRGFALFVGLIMLLLMSLVGITAMQVTLMQERMAGNFKVQHDGFEQGETVLAGPTGQLAIRAAPTSFGLNCFGGACVTLITGGAPSLPNQVPWINWLTSEPASPLPVPQKNLLYRPQLNATVPNAISMNYYSVAAIGQDSSGDAKTALQGIYLLCSNCGN
jgi:Tfp pilus assembly protein PilX